MNRSEQFYKKILTRINEGKRVSPLRAVRAHCLECCGFSVNNVKRCDSEFCVLYKFRMGDNRTGDKDSDLVRDEEPNGVKIEKEIVN